MESGGATVQEADGRADDRGDSGEPRRRRTAVWLFPTLAFIAMAGPFGVTGKLALDQMAWQELLLWTMIAYLTISVVLLVGFRERMRIGPAAGWGALAGLFVIGTFTAVSLALERGDASQVIPVTASYPIFTAILAVIVLGERLSRRRLAGTAIVILGVVVVSI